jgi:hypothetical protein
MQENVQKNAMRPRSISRGLYGTVALASGVALFVLLASSASATPAASANREPSWWSKYQHLLQVTPKNGLTDPGCHTDGSNADVSCEDGPQSETSIAIDPSNSNYLVTGSNDINRLPMRAWVSSDGGDNWDGGHDLPLPPPLTNNGTDFGTDPGLVVDSSGRMFYSYIIVFFNKSQQAIQGSEVAVARSTDHGQTWTATYINPVSGKSAFNDKSMIAVDPSNGNVYVAWDTEWASHSSVHNVVLFSRSTDNGVSFSAPITITPQKGGPQDVFAADPFVAPNHNVYVAYQDVQHNQLSVVKSTNLGTSFGAPVAIASTQLSFDVVIPAAATRTPFVYPACGADNTNKLYCSWMDETASNGTDIFVSHTTTNDTTWSPRVLVNDDGGDAEQFFQWLSVDPTSHAVTLSWYDTRNDPDNVETDVYFSESTDGGVTFADNTKVTNAQTDESAANPDAQAHDQYGDYEGIAAYGGTAHPVWTDGRLDSTLGEEVFTAAVSES